MSCSGWELVVTVVCCPGCLSAVLSCLLGLLYQLIDMGYASSEPGVRTPPIARSEKKVLSPGLDTSVRM